MVDKALVLLSGGLDSATCLGLAKAEGMACYALSFAYGQRHNAELQAARRVADALGVKEHKVVTLDLAQFGGSALTDKAIDVPDYEDSPAIPVTYVPARNTVFLSIALAYAEVIKAKRIYFGASSIDYSGYCDCRPEYLAAFQAMADLATKAGIEGEGCQVITPLLHLSKAQTIQAGLGVGVDYALTVSCYQADEQGQACGRCDSCYLRRKGFTDAGVVDPTPYQVVSC